ncbi:hypothetical protein SAY87_026301 [Trapa incisa]|uniref:Sm domain-containing protein n=1 Tax=Trapa incisa TaxID=236973 RepID=A0AAN7JJV6_9MYRT|nr:hypothetical protein SAY87_026301 [Trapa incisa]
MTLGNSKPVVRRRNLLLTDSLPLSTFEHRDALHRTSLRFSPLERFNGLFIRLFFSYFKDLVGREVTVELKNDLAIRGTLHSVDQYLNIKLENTRVVDQDKYPHMLSVRNCFIRGSVVRYVQLPPDGVDIELLHDATRREARGLQSECMLDFEGRIVL